MVAILLQVSNIFTEGAVLNATELLIAHNTYRCMSEYTKTFLQFLKRITSVFCHQAWSSPFILELLRGGKCPGLGQQRSL